MATATLTDGPAVQLTFPWALPKAEHESPIVAERRPQSASGRPSRAARQHSVTVKLSTAVVPRTPVQNPTGRTGRVQSVTVQNRSIVEPSTTVPPHKVAPVAECADSLQAALCEDRIGKPIRVGAVMFRLLKRYGITDQEIAEGIAAYTAKRNAAAS